MQCECGGMVKSSAGEHSQSFTSRRQCRSPGLVTKMAWIACLVLLVSVAAAERNRIPCYDRFHKPQRCMPPFVNAAFDLPVPVDASNTCGVSSITEFCVQTQIAGPRQTKSCTVCDANDPLRSHPAHFLTDFNNNDNLTWWQSETMLQGIQHPNSVNLTIHLGKSFDITYVKLKFKSSRPESFAIYKRTTETSDWVPYQFYSATCDQTYRRRPDELITKDDETKALCTADFSDISPLSGGSVAFSTLEGRPSKYEFETSKVLQDFVTATDIRIVLSRMNTFGDEVFGDPYVLKSYFYAISDLAVGGRCQCFGHASKCVRSTGQGLEDRLVCQCEHHTQGQSCEECEPFYNDRPWHRSTATDAHECQACDCNGLSNHCFFDETLYRRTGRGGHCLECRENTAGTNCERCKDKYYKTRENERCQPCNCDPIGAQDEQCDTSGRCRCKPGVTGEKCDRCMPNFYEFGQYGCRQCQCLVAGSENNNPKCVPDTGTCTCKEFVEGQNCDQCTPGYFNLQEDNDFGCIACFCYGHSSICSSAPGFFHKVIHSEFNSGRQKWHGETVDGREVTIQYNGGVENIGISAPGSDATYFVAPGRYLGNQQFSYDKYLTFTLRVGEENTRGSISDIIIEGDGLKVTSPIFYQNNPAPRTINQDYKFRLNEHPSYRWTPTLSGTEFIRMLSNLTAIKIRGTYAANGVGFVDDVKLDSARQGSGGQGEVTNIELCDCPDGYVGQFCESCAPGYHRDPPGDDKFARCIPCNCNGHSDSCEVTTGRCICNHHTTGQNCERCESGYYGYALAGTPNDCQPCPCPDGGECMEMLNGDVACINCREGYTGNRCEFCADGYFGDPQGLNGPRRPCERCVCNDNIDPNAVANCNGTTGQCLKCIHNTGGFSCDRCLTGFYGDALSLPRGQCKACGCYPPGTYRRGGVDDTGPIECDAVSGECSCQFNVVGRQCDQCIEGYWNIDSGSGCERCECNNIGSWNQSCDLTSGQCHCRPGVGGRNCDHCMEGYFGFSYNGCQACNCDPEGSYDTQCDERTGQCPCKPSVDGRECNRCMENKYNITAGCIDCPACYNLVQDQVNILRKNINELQIIINNIGDKPQSINDTDFKEKMKAVNESVNKLLEDAIKNSGGEDNSLAEQFLALQQAVNDVVAQCGRIALDLGDTRSTSGNSVEDITVAEELIDEAERRLKDAEDYLNNEGQEALRKAREAQEMSGQQSDRMTEIAKEARQLAEQQEEDAMDIENTANEALNTSKEALRIAEEALQKPWDIADKIDDLKRDIKRIDNLYDQTKDLAEEALKKAKEAYSDSLGIYTEADSIELPYVNIDGLKEDAREIKQEAEGIKNEANQLIEQNRELMEDVERQKQMAEDMLQDGIQTQQVTDQLMAEADAARGIARDAVEKAEQTLEEAKRVLKILQEFDEKVRQSKAKAEEAKKKVPGIEDTIDDAEDKTREAEYNLDDAWRDAMLARDIGANANDTAVMAAGQAEEILQDAEDTKDRALDLKDEAQQLEEEVNNAERRLKSYEDQAEDDAGIIKDALKKADEAKTVAKESSSKVRDAVTMVNDILTQLDNLDTIDIDKLDELEQDLADAEEEIARANIEQRYNDLLDSRNNHLNWVQQYTNEQVQLQKDVQNIRQINETIPRQCFKKITLEPTNPSPVG